MPRVHTVKRARVPNHVVTQKDIDKAKATGGDEASYYWWKFRYGGKRCSKTRPKRAQLTLSEYYAAVYELQDEMQNARLADIDAEDLESMRDDWASQATEIGDECQGKFDNMPEGLQQGPTGELLENRVNAMEEWTSELEGVDLTREDGDETPMDEWIQEKYDELLSIEPDIE